MMAMKLDPRIDRRGRLRYCRGMDLALDMRAVLPGGIAWLVDEAAGSPSPDGFLTELGGRLLGWVR